MISSAVALLAAATAASPAYQPELGSRSAPVIQVDGLRFRDLNRSGGLEPYEDWRRPAGERAADLVGRMTLPEKAGLMVHATPPGQGGGLTAPWDMAKLRPQVQDLQIRFFIHRVSGDPAELARTANAAQEMAENTRLGVPIVFSSDPRHHRRPTFGASVDPGRFSQWPEPTGLAAARDPDLVRRFGAVTAKEYRAIGITMALSPMADLATEPQWPRTNGTFGDDVALVSRLAGAYVEGIQGGVSGPGPSSVAAVAKHWVGYGAQPDGFDAHNPYGRRLAFPGGGFDLHVEAFQGVLSAKASGVMPTYGQPPADLLIDGKPAEPVAAGFSRQMITDLLRGRYQFDGFVLTDWKITDDCLDACQNGTLDIEQVGMPWGVEKLSKEDRFAKALEAGVDQFGGVDDVDILLKLVGEGKLAEQRVDLSARRLLTTAFALGLFENPYVDPAAAEQTVGAPELRAEGLAAQRRSLVLLENRARFLPLKGDGKKVWLWKVSPSAAKAYGLTVVDTPEDADLAIVRVAAPYRFRTNYFFGARYREGPLNFAADNEDLAAFNRARRAAPTVVTAYLDRPAVLTPFKGSAKALLAEFGVSDEALFDVLFGKAAPSGKLPFELPSSQAAVERQKPDLPTDSERPLFRSGFGLTY